MDKLKALKNNISLFSNVGPENLVVISFVSALTASDSTPQKLASSAYWVVKTDDVKAFLDEHLCYNDFYIYEQKLVDLVESLQVNRYKIELAYVPNGDDVPNACIYIHQSCIDDHSYHIFQGTSCPKAASEYVEKIVSTKSKDGKFVFGHNSFDQLKLTRCNEGLQEVMSAIKTEHPCIFDGKYIANTWAAEALENTA